MENINIVSILEKHLPFVPADLNQRKIKAAIKEIVEAVIDKCVEEAEAIEGYNTGLAGSAASVDKESILKVKEMINY